jgi:hypothetical protein
MSRTWFSSVAIAMAALALVQAQVPVDEQRSAWRYRREVALPSGSEGALVAVAVPPEVQARSQPGLRDVRLVDRGGREWPFLLHEDAARRVERRWTGFLMGAQHERRGYTTWTVDFGELIAFDRLVLEVPGADFAKRLAIDVSTDGSAWREVGSDYWVFDRPWQAERVHDTTIELPPGEGRFVRVQADDTASRPIDVRGAVALWTDHLAGESWSEEVVLELLSAENGRARYRVPVPDGHPLRRLELDADNPAFARRVTVYESRRDGERTAGSGLLYRVPLPGDAPRLEDREIAVHREAGGPLIVEIVNGDNPSLVNPRVRMSGPSTVLLTAATAPAVTLYYGNAVTRAPMYELEQFRIALASVPRYPTASPGAEVENPSFRQPAPLEFVAARGAVVQARQWRFIRTFVVGGAEDLYTFTVAPADLARLRDDLGDLRIVDGSNRQVPYILEPEATVSPVALTLAPAEPRRGVERASSLRLSLPGHPRDGSPIRFTALRLQVAESFFQRSATVLQPRQDAAAGAVKVASVTLASSRRDRRTEPVWVQVPIGEVRATELLLEVNDGDNAPLTVLAAQGVVPVPRVTFQAAPGEYRLLIGNAQAQPPSYELAALRREVLAYAAGPVELPATDLATANPGYERGVADYVRDAPPRAVLWTALAGAVVALLVLTRRILARAERRDGGA